MDTSTRDQDAAIDRAMEWLLRREMAPRDAVLERDFQKWLGEADANRKAYASVQSTWADLGKLPVKQPAEKASAANVVPLPALPATIGKPRRMRWLATAAALAAACLLIVAFPMLHRAVVADHATGVAELREVILPDGSSASLDASSAIAVDYEGTGRRITLLAGEAFFQVTRDAQRPFSVAAGEVSVVVTGTAFSVRKTASTVDVAVQSGTVEVLQEGKRAGEPLRPRRPAGRRPGGQGDPSRAHRAGIGGGVAPAQAGRRRHLVRRHRRGPRTIPAGRDRRRRQRR